MRDNQHIDQALHGLSELALVALLVCLALLPSGSPPALLVCAVASDVAVLAFVVRSHVRLVRSARRANKDTHPAVETASDAAPEPIPAAQADLSPEPPAKTLPEADRPEPTPAANEDETPAQVPTPFNLGEDLAPSPALVEQVSDSTPAVAPSGEVEPSAPEELEAEPLPSLDFASLASSLLATDDPIAELKRFVGDIRTRQAEHGDDPAIAPCGLERYAARMLEEAGLFASDVELPSLTAIRPRTSHMLYLRTSDSRMPYLAKLRVIKLEAALNAIRFASASLPADATQEAAYLLNQGLARSIVAQARPIDEPVQLAEGVHPDGEWAVRYGISEAIETLQLPYRLVARYRTNVADGNVAIEVDLTPADAFPTSCHVDGLGIIPSTGDMRQQAAADYALRLAILLAASAFRCSERVRHVWVAGVMETATRRTCYYSVDFDRYRFAKLDLTDPGDLSETYRSFAPVLRYEDGWLRPVRQSFHLEEERFCPSRRYLPVSLSSRRLAGREAASLGTDHVSGLSIEEADGRALVASAIMMRMAPATDDKATQKNVRTVMDLAGDDPDPTVRTAAERVVRGLIDGSLEDDVYSVAEEFVRGDAVTRATDRAKELMMGQHPEQAQRVLQQALAPLDEAGIFDDSHTIAYRYFSSYVERALYNRLYGSSDAAKTVMLVPDSYYEAHLLLSVTHLMQGQHEQALVHAHRIVQLAPLDARARLHLVKCLEVLDRDDEAVGQLMTLLDEAHEPQGLGMAYYRMAFFQWKQGNIEAAQACYQRAMQFLPMAVPMMAMELSVLYLQNPGALQAEVTEQQVEDTLRAHGIPIAPTEHTSEVFYECAQASLDAEIFPVARNFADVMRAFSTDDVLEGLIRSLEDAPDH